MGIDFRLIGVPFDHILDDLSFLLIFFLLAVLQSLLKRLVDGNIGVDFGFEGDFRHFK